LKSLRFDAAETRLKPKEMSVEALPYFGIYVRINKNQARAFSGSELDESSRKRAFGHYFNALVGLELCRLTTWVEGQLESAFLLDLSGVAEAYGLSNVKDARELGSSLEHEVAKLELFVNNGGRTAAPIFSIPEAPIKRFAEALKSRLLQSKLLFCCVDEYENLSEEQQAVLNTYIKHSEPPLSYKIGLRKFGLHTRQTIDSGDQIQTPDDYLEIDIAEEGFEPFAEHVAEHRLRRAREQGVEVPDNLRTFMPDLPFDEEAELLGCERITKTVLDRIATNCVDILEWAREMPPSKLYFVGYWAEASGGDVCALAKEWKSAPDTWEVRLRNHGYASLFWLSKGRKGARIRKYYAGVTTFLAMASGNIRYFLELIDVAINFQFEDSKGVGDGSIVLDPRIQTEAARAVGKRRLAQLEGLSERGVALKRFVLAIGKVFFELARDPVGHAPEQNLFVVTGYPGAVEEVAAVLREGIAHLAFEATPRTKATSEAEMRDDEYRLHPIFCAFFEFSHRKKRRITLSADSLLKVTSQPAQAIGEMLEQRDQTEVGSLPEQLAMFTDFFDGVPAK